MNIIFCNINWMKYYNGASAKDRPKHAGVLVKDPSDVFEQNNFRDFNGKCYGYVRSGGDILLDRHFRGVPQGTKSMKDLTIVWCAAISEEESRIVGWYRDATAYKEMVSLPLYEEEYIDFSFMADAENCVLVPEEERTFVIKTSKSSASRKGAIKSNIWYAKSEYAQREFIPRVTEYIEDYKGASAMMRIKDLKDQLPEEEITGYEEALLKARELYDEENFRQAVLYYNAARGIEDSYDASYELANAYFKLSGFDEVLELAENMIHHHGEKVELVELAFMASDMVLDMEKAPRYYRRLQELEGQPLTSEEYYEYYNELQSLNRSYKQYI